MTTAFLGQRDSMLTGADDLRAQPLRQAYSIRDEIQELNQTTAMMEQGSGQDILAFRCCADRRVALRIQWHVA